MNHVPSYCPASQQDWRDWLQQHYASKSSVWLVYYKKKSGKANLAWSGAVDEALCFGWIDSTARPIDDHTYKQFFTRRKPNAVWSKINKVKVERLTVQGLMTQPGYEAIERAKQNGCWSVLDEVEELRLPKDLLAAFKGQRVAKKYFLSLSKSVQKAMLQWLVLAKKPETRLKRITEIVEQATLKLKPKGFWGE